LTPEPPGEVVRFDTFEVNLRTGEVWRQGRKLRVPHQSFVVLASLVVRPGDLVTREELRAKVWPPDTAVEYEQGLNAIVNRLREVLGDAAAKPRYIETLPKRGYRFIGRLEPSTTPAVETPDTTSASVETSGQRGDGPQPNRHVRLAFLVYAAIAVAAVGLALQALSRRSPGNADSLTPFAPDRLRPLTTLDGQEVAPSFSPDGTRIAFAWKQPGDSGFDLYLGDLAASAPLRLTHAPAQTILPAWSPDGSQVVFLRSAEAGAGGLFVVPALGGAERRLAAANAPASLGQVSWSPDGSRIAYAATDETGSSVVRLLSPADLAVESVAAGDSCRDAGLPAFSADGRLLAFVCTTSVAVFQIRVMDVGSRAVRDCGTMLGYPQGLAWSPDGASLLAANDAGDGGRLWRVPIQGGTPIMLPVGESGSAPTISPLSGRLAYVRSRRDVDIRLVRLDGDAQRAEASLRVFVSSRVDMMPRLSPDGRRVAFQSDRSGANEIWVGSLADGQVTRLTSFEGPLVGGPDWCQDGRRVAFDARATGASAVYVATLGDGVPRRIETSVANLSLPVWSPSCRFLVAGDGKGTMYRVPTEGGAAVRLTGQSSYYAQMSGDRVVFNVKQTGGVQLWWRPIDGGEEAPVTGMPLLRYDEPWTTTAFGVFIVRTVDGRSSVQFYDWETRSLRRVAWLAERPLPLGGLGLSVSADGRTLLFAHEERVESDIMLVDRK
jgi:Tol biopolymer transport system component/DNA-binding winged helix-turn-helix (wHTH) protein